MDLVDDDRVDRSQHFPRPRSEHQIERFRCGDEDVGGITANPLPLFRRRIAGARGDRDVRRLPALPGGGDGESRQGGPEVAFDVIAKGLQRRDVEDGDTAALRRRSTLSRRQRFALK